MSRFKLTIEYDGTRYAGWQMQKGGKTIQGEILDACREVFKGEEIDIFGAGRTDGGVHASGQVAHFSDSSQIFRQNLQLRQAVYFWKRFITRRRRSYIRQSP